MANDPILLNPPEGVPRFYPIRGHTSREIDNVLAHCGVMCADYDRHYPELLDHMKTYLKAKDESSDYFSAPYPELVHPLTLSELETRITVAVGAGFFILSPQVALYFMAIDPVLYIDQVDYLLRDSNTRWGAVCVNASLLTALLTAFAGERVGKDHLQYLEQLVKDLPINSPEYIEQLAANVRAVLTQRFTSRTLH